MDFDPVGAVMAWISIYGLIGLFAVALIERFVPVIPSYGLLLAVGIGAADEAWSLSTAFFATTMGSVGGCVGWFHAVRRLGETRSTRFLSGAGRFFGMSADRIEREIASFRRNQTALAFALQLVPTVRLFAPAFVALLRGSSRSVLVASAAGIAVWNGLFIGIGFYAAHSIETANTTVVALAALGGLLIAEAALFWIVRRVPYPLESGGHVMRVLMTFCDGRRSATPSHQRIATSESLKQQRMAETFGFFWAWLRNPLRVAAVAPSGQALASLITSEISHDTGPVIELGPGTGAFTRPLIARGVKQENLALIEFGSEFAAALHFQYPQARTVCIDAARLRTVDLFDGKQAGAVVSGLPLLSMPQRKVIAILTGAFRKMKPDGALYQFTYGPRCPVPLRLLDRLGLKAERLGGTLANVPPAAVYRITRRLDSQSQASNQSRQSPHPGPPAASPAPGSVFAERWAAAMRRNSTSRSAASTGWMAITTACPARRSAGKAAVVAVANAGKDPGNEERAPAPSGR
nr:VTT domain-containing protein [Geminicoccus flavidas]